MNSKVILYSTHCPRCNVLTKKLQQSEIPFEEVNDDEVMRAQGFTDAPKLEVDGVVMDFKQAVQWIGEQ